MATPSSPNLAFAEIAPHALHLVVVSGRKIVAWRAFRADAKADIAAFVAEYQLAGLVRASILGDRLYLHRSTDTEAAAIRQPAAFQNHLAKLPHGFSDAPGAVVCDTTSGLTPDAARVSPWMLTVFDPAAFATVRETLGELGLAPADITLAAPTHVGAVVGSLSGGRTAAVLIPGVDEAWLIAVSAEGVQSVSSVPFGFTQIFEAVQKGLGLKFRAAAGKLFFNDSYDFSEAAGKITEHLVVALRPEFEGKAFSALHVVGLLPGQSWLAAGLSTSLGMSVWDATGSSVAAKLGLDAAGEDIPVSAAGLLQVAAAGSKPAPWVQATVETLVAEALARPKSAAPFPAAAAVVAAAPAPAPVAAAPIAPVVAPVAPVAPAPIKPVAPAAALPKPASAPKPAPKPAAAPKPVVKPAAKAAPAPAPVLAVAVEESAPASSSDTPAPTSKSKAPLFIAAGVGVVAAIVGLAFHFRSPSTRTAQPVTPSVEQPTPTPPPAGPTPTPGPAQPTPSLAQPTPLPLPTIKSVVGDQAANDPRKFSNDRYRLEVSEKGFIQSLTTSRDEILVESAAGISLQGSYIGTDGRRKWFNVGGVDDAGYVASVRKSVREGVTIFDVTVQHPRFTMEQKFTCLPESVQVSAKFTPINLRDPRGAIAAVHSVRLAPVALNPSLRMRALPDAFLYSMKPTTLRVQFDPTNWARDGAGGLQTVIAGENGVVFHFTENTEPARNTLSYEIQFGVAG